MSILLDQPQDPRPKRGRPRDESLADRRREQILAVATEIFARHGYPGTDLEEVARRIGVGKGTIYRYFASKELLFQAAVDRGMKGLRAAIAAATEGVDDPLETIRAGIKAYLTYFDSHPECVELFIQERAEFRDRKRPTYFEHRDANRGRWQKLYAELMAAGRVRQIPVERISDVVSGVLYGTMFTNYFAGRAKTAAEQAEDIIEIVFNGILTR